LEEAFIYLFLSTPRRLFSPEVGPTIFFYHTMAAVVGGDVHMA
jgi:hypothetical protein